MKRSRLLLVLAVVTLAAARITAGCAGQSEGQLCNTLNGTNPSNDCAAGLVCTPKFGEDLGACCPMPPAVSTQPACVQNSNTGTGGGGGSGTGGSSTGGSSTGGSTTTTSTGTTTTSTGTTTTSTGTTTTTTTTTTGTGDAGADGGDGG